MGVDEEGPSEEEGDAAVVVELGCLSPGSGNGGPQVNPRSAHWPEDLIVLGRRK